MTENWLHCHSSEMKHQKVQQSACSNVRRQLHICSYFRSVLRSKWSVCSFFWEISGGTESPITQGFMGLLRVKTIWLYYSGLLRDSFHCPGLNRWRGLPRPIGRCSWRPCSATSNFFQWISPLDLEDGMQLQRWWGMPVECQRYHISGKTVLPKTGSGKMTRRYQELPWCVFRPLKGLFWWDFIFRFISAQPAQQCLNHSNGVWHMRL